MITKALEFWKLPDFKREDFGNEEQQQHIENLKRSRNFKSRVKIAFKPFDQTRLLQRIDYELRNSLQLDLSMITSARLREISAVGDLPKAFKQTCSIYDYKCFASSGNLVLLLGCGVIYIK